ncbi:MAG: class I SAM-dependent methyltransferase [Ignavibacteriaceae bacterium]
MNKYFEENKKSWNRRVNLHYKSDFYDVKSFLQGGSSLKFIEVEALGDVRKKSVLHLQCHFGLDSLSLARKGAIVTGIDFSDQAISTAKKLSEQSNISARFICCNLYESEHYLNEQFDIVFTSYGVLGWLDDLQEWGRLVAKFLKPGGFFFIAEFHPFLGLFDEKFEKLKYSYFYSSDPGLFTSAGSYAMPDDKMVFSEYQWNHSLQDVFQVMLKNDLRIEDFREYPFSVYNCFPNLVQGKDGWWRIGGLFDKIPMMFSLKALKSAI